MDGLLLVFVGGVGGAILLLAGQWAHDSRTPAPKPPPDRVAQLERLVESYRGEVRDLQDRVDRWFRRSEKRAERETAADPAGDGKPAAISTGFPQTKEQLRAAYLAAKLRR
jgi:hypothetical protein